METTIVNGKRGITLIALIITVIVMLILAGVSISILTNDRGIFEQTTYSAELSKFSQIKEAIKLYDIYNMLEDRGLPVRDNVSSEELNNNQKLKQEIGYYRVYMMMGEKPILPQDFSGDFIVTPSGIADLYYLDKTKLGINVEEYLYDAVTEEIFNVEGIKLKGGMAYSESGMKEIMVDNFVPSFIALGNVIIPEPPVQDIDERTYKFVNLANTSTNLYKLYNNGDVYGIGQKGYALHNTQEEMDRLRLDKWTEIRFEDILEGFSKINVGSQMYRTSQVLINDNGEAYVSGENGRRASNKFGLDVDVLQRYSVNGLNKLNFTYGKIKRVFTGDDTTFIITEENRLYACGKNNYGQLGIGSYMDTEEYQEVQGIPNVEKIKNIHTYNELNSIIIELENNQFYFAGLNASYIIGDGRSNSFKTNIFVQIWNVGEYDIDQDIKKIVLFYGGTVVLKKDGTLLITNTNDRSMLTDFIDSDKTKFRQLRTEVGQNITNVIPFYDYGIVIEKTESNIKTYYGYSYSLPQQIGIGNKDFTTDEIKLYEIELPNDLVSDGVKEFNNVRGRNGLIFISNTGNVYYTGQGSCSGIENQTDVVSNVTKLPIDNIDKLYTMDSTYGLTYVYLQSNDGKIYTIQNPLVQLNNSIYDYTFKNIMSNVKEVSIGSNKMAYLTNDNKLYVAGKDKSQLGLGTVDTSEQLTPVEVTDSNIRGKVKAVYSADTLYVLTNDHKLYGTGSAGTSGNNSPGWTEQSSQISFTEILTNVEGFSTVSNRKIAYNQEKVWIWYGGSVWGEIGNIPIETSLASISASLVNNVQAVVCNIDSYAILTKNGQVWIKGNIPYSGTGVKHTNFTQIPQSSFDNKKVVKIVTTGGDKRPFIALTEDGKLYGWGNDSSILGLGITGPVAQNTPILLPIDNVEDIVATNSGFIVKKYNGEVWATGQNEAGIFGRWVSSERKYAKTINQTAYEWVRCPALEK